MRENILAEPSKIKSLLDQKLELYNRPSFIKEDPVSIPHRFTKIQDIEIAGLFAAVFAWGNRTTIIRKSSELIALMGNSPYEFVINHREEELKRLLDFKHRTFVTTDLLYFISFLRHHYSTSPSLETAFTMHGHTVYDMLSGFHRYFFSLEDAPHRTKKHISTPERNSSCKRLNMFLRWMVRKDQQGVDFGIWKDISPSQLVCPLDLHVARVATRLGILERKQADWKAAMEITGYLRKLDPADPIKYDIALFGMGVMEKYQ